MDKRLFIIYIFIFLFYKSFGLEYTIGNRAAIPNMLESNLTEVFVIYEPSNLEIQEEWEYLDDGTVALYFHMESKNLRSIRELKFQNDFLDKFTIIENKSYLLPFGSIDKIYFDENGVIDDKKVKVTILGSKLKFETSKDVDIKGNGKLVLYLSPNYEKYKEITYKLKTDYSYKNSSAKNIKKTSYAPDFYFLNVEKSNIKVMRYQAISENYNGKMELPYTEKNLVGKIGDKIFYKVIIKNDGKDPVFNLKIINPVGENSVLSYGDNLLTGTGFPVMKIKDVFVPIKKHPLENYKGNIEALVPKLDGGESIELYYCVEISK